MKAFAVGIAIFTPTATAWMDGSAPFYAQSSAAGVGEGVKVTPLFKTTLSAPNALCLDGTPAAYYFRPGSGDGVKKWYIHHEGGGWCESLDDCLARSFTGLGSSKTYANTSIQEAGYFSEDASVNPMMHNWNTVFMPYCDGASFSGNNATVAVHKGKALHFHGKSIREAIAASLLSGAMEGPSTASLSEATDLIVSGCSAGGLATFLHTDQWCDAVARVQPSVKCAGLPDSGFFLDYQKPGQAPLPPGQLSDTIPGDYHRGLQWSFEMQNATAGINVDCVAAHQSGEKDAWKCMFAEHVSPFIHTPIFALQSTYDTWQTRHVLDGSLAVNDINILGANITARLAANLFHPHPQSGAFLDSCAHHCGMWGSIRIDGELVSVAFQKWYEGLGSPGNKATWAQGQAYPCAACCLP